MKKSHCNIIIPVSDLDACRIFYREVVGLGEPVVDSGFLVIFKISEGTTLTLERLDAKYLERVNCAISFSYVTENVDEIRSRIENSGYTPPEKAILPGQRGGWRCFDPEGNVFYLREFPFDLNDKLELSGKENNETSNN